MNVYRICQPRGRGSFGIGFSLFLSFANNFSLAVLVDVVFLLLMGPSSFLVLGVVLFPCFVVLRLSGIATR